MSFKKGTYVVNALIALLALAFLIMAQNFPAALVKLSIQPSYYPTGVAVLLIVACAVSTVETYRKEDKKIEIKNLFRVLMTIGICVAFAVLWRVTGYFYPVSLAATVALMYLLDPRESGLKKLGRVLLYSLILQAAVYLVFTQLMKFKL